eukprot:m.227766 g.227766  ORF g.227766 m.227766 type:complete len:110 (-) comp26416_c0_seq18:139-468(-)
MALVRELIEEAKERTKLEVENKRKAAKKLGQSEIEEDNPVVYQEAVRKMRLKVFAEAEIRRQELTDKTQKAKREEAEEKEQAQEAKRRKKEVEEKWEVRCPYLFLVPEP